MHAGSSAIAIDAVWATDLVLGRLIQGLAWDSLQRCVVADYRDTAMIEVYTHALTTAIIELG
jgi:hypothetical protein